MRYAIIDILLFFISEFCVIARKPFMELNFRFGFIKIWCKKILLLERYVKPEKSVLIRLKKFIPMFEFSKIILFITTFKNIFNFFYYDLNFLLMMLCSFPFSKNFVMFIIYYLYHFQQHLEYFKLWSQFFINDVVMLFF